MSLQQAADELSAAQQLTSEHMATLQERETALEDALQQAANLKQVQSMGVKAGPVLSPLVP